MQGDKNLARQWVSKSESDLLDADNNLSAAKVPFDTVCFHCQQAAEKLLKGFLVMNGRPAPHTHDLMLLLNECVTIQPAAISIREALVILNPYAVEVRYPDDTLNPTIEDAREARAAADEVKSWIKKAVPNIFPDPS